MDSQLSAIVNHDALFQVAGSELDGNVQHVSGISEGVAHVPHEQIVVLVQFGKGQTDDNRPQIVEDPKG